MKFPEMSTKLEDKVCRYVILGFLSGILLLYSSCLILALFV